MRRSYHLLSSLAFVGALTASGAQAQFADNFDSYANGTLLHDVNGWKGWDNNPGLAGIVDSSMALTAPNAIAIGPGTDALNTLGNPTSGCWHLGVDAYIPSGSVGNQYLILLNTYNDFGPNSWSVQLRISTGNGTIVDEYDQGWVAPFSFDCWFQFQFEIDLDNDLCSVRIDLNCDGLLDDDGADNVLGTMDDELVSSGLPWSSRGFGNGTTAIGAVDLFGNGASTIYYDNVSLQPCEPSLCVPTYEGTFAGTGISRTLEISGDLLYIPEESTPQGVSIVDISTPSAPTLLGHYSTGAFATTGVVVVEDVAYVAHGGSELTLVDVSDPTNPVRLGGLATGSGLTSVAVQGSIAYVGLLGDEFLVVDVANPRAPKLLASLPMTLPYDIEMAGRYAYVGCVETGLLIVDILDSSAPVVVGSYDTPDFAIGVEYSDGIAYVADRWGGLQLIDVTDPTSPAFVGSFLGDDTRNIEVSGSVAYLSRRTSGVAVLDVSNPAVPSLLGTIASSGSSVGLALRGSTLCLAKRASSDGTGIDVYDVSGCAAASAPNDACADAISVEMGYTNFSSLSATGSGFQLSCQSATSPRDIWFTFRAPATATTVIDLSGSGFDTVLEVFDGSDCSQPTSIACNDDGGTGLTSRVAFDASAGSDYLVCISGFGNAAAGLGHMQIYQDLGLGDAICAGQTNSTGLGGTLSMEGSDIPADNALTIHVQDLPANSLGYFVTSSELIPVANPGGSMGDLCIGSLSMGRFAGDVLDTGPAGQVSFTPDLSALPTPSGSVAAAPGDTACFQFWYRDMVAGQATSNFSGARCVTFRDLP